MAVIVTLDEIEKYGNRSFGLLFKVVREIVPNKAMLKHLKDRNYYYNCHGFTSFALGLNRSLHWIDGEDMQPILDEYCKRVKTPKRGDIVSYWCDNGYHLLHTAIYIGNNLVIHKPGSMDLELQSVDMPYYYRYGNNRHYYRIIS